MDFPTPAPQSQPYQPAPAAAGAVSLPPKPPVPAPAPAVAAGPQPVPPRPPMPSAPASAPISPVPAAAMASAPFTPPAPSPSSLPPRATAPATAFGTMPTTPVQIPIQSQPMSTSGEDQVYTMPEKFLSTGQPPLATQKKSHKKLTIVLIAIIALAILAIIGGILYYIFVVLPSTEQSTSKVEIDINATTKSDAETNENENLNVNNANAAANVNANLIANAAANDNVNAETNANTNANTNTNVNAVTNTNTNTVVNTNETTAPISSKDGDNDGLTNEEEKIWGTKADLPDTDSDGYQDGKEILAGYDPLNPVSSGRLQDSSSVGTYNNKDYGYTILYPVNWLADALSEGDASEVIFTPSSLDIAGQFMEVAVVENPTGLSATDWYIDQLNLDENEAAPELESIVTFSGIEGVMSLVGFTAYFTTNNYVYAVNYGYGDAKEVDFTTTFQMMVKSFTLTKKAQKANDAVTADSNTNTNATNNNSETNSNTYYN